MIGALFAILAQLSGPVGEMYAGHHLNTYGICALERAASLTLTEGDNGARTAEAIADESIADCSSLRDAAIQELSPTLLNEPQVLKYLRDRNLTVEQGRALLPQELDRSLRQQILQRVARLRGDNVRDGAHAEDR